MREPRQRAILTYLGSGLLSLVVVFFVMELWRADFNIPFAYEWRDLRRGGETLDPIGSNDALLFCTFFKSIRENGWYLHNPALGAPGALDLHDYPIGENAHYFLAKVIGWLTPNYGVAINLFFPLGFPLTMLTSLYCFRQFKLSTPLGIVGSLLFTFAPYHFLRGEQHLWLATYYAVPLMVVVLFWVLQGESLFPFVAGKGCFPIGITRKGVAAVLICVLLASTGVYYSLFTVFLLFVSCLLRCRSWKSLLPSVLLAMVLLLTILLNTAPTLAYVYEHGRNREVPSRYPAQVEMFGLKITQMLLPVMHHRLPALAEFSSKYFESAPLVNENATACLGLVASAGFLLLLAWLLGLRWQTPRESILTALSALTICGVLLATIGGFGSLLGYGVSPTIRCYNRISILIAFFALLAVLFLFENLRQRWGGTAQGRFGGAVAVGLLLVIGLADQTTEFFVPPYAQSEASFRSDRGFVRRIEAKLPAGAMIFQLPYMPFPEGPPGEMALLRGYLHSRTLRWSFGAMTGRETDRWVKQTLLADSNLQRIIQMLMSKDFKGLSLDRQLLRDSDKLEAWLKQMVDAAPIESEDGRFAFYSLAEGVKAPAH